MANTIAWMDQQHENALLDDAERADLARENDQINREKPAVYEVPAVNLEKMRAGLVKLERKAAKLGVEAPRIYEVFEEDRPILDDKGKPSGQLRRYHFIVVEGEAPKLAGWTFVGSIDVVPEVGNILRTVPGETMPKAFRSAEMRCDHCRTNRRRVSHHVVRNDVGEFKIVGSSCVGDFLGGVSPDHVVARSTWLASLNELLSSAEDEGWTGGRILSSAMAGSPANSPATRTWLQRLTRPSAKYSIRRR